MTSKHKESNTALSGLVRILGVRAEQKDKYAIVRAMMALHDIKPVEIARKTGKSAAMVTKVIRGKNKSYSIMQCIAETIGVDTKELWGEDCLPRKTKQLHAGGAIMSLKNLNEIKHQLQIHKQGLKDQFGVTAIGVFGSYVRGEQTEGSDVDILIDLEKPFGLVKFIQLERYISELLEIKVDLTTKDALKPFIGKEILREVSYV